MKQASYKDSIEISFTKWKYICVESIKRLINDDFKSIDKLRISANSFYFLFLFCPIEMKTNQIQRNSLYDKKFNLHRSSSLAGSSYKKERRWSNFHYCLLLSYRFSFNLIQTLKFYRQQRIVKWKAAVIKSRTMH